MKRQIVLAAIACVLWSGISAAAGREYFELRTYQLNSAEKAAVFDKMMAAAIPLLEKAGHSPVGVFKAKREKDGDPNWRYMISSAKSLDSFAASRRVLADDPGFREKAREYVGYDKSDPAYTRISVATFAPFDGFPKLVTPAPDPGGERFFELRIYESHSELKALLKVGMFNDAELDIFAATGLRGVFFGSALSGDNLPNLTYMLVYDSEAEHKRVWDAFRQAPAWKKLKSEEKYKDTVSKITSLFLVATDYSGLR